MQIYVLPKGKALLEAAESLNKKFKEWEGEHILFLSSGGSSLTLLDYLDTSTFTENVTVGMLDDRYSRDREVNNFALLQATNFYTKLSEKGVIFIDSYPKEGESIEELRDRFEKSLRDWIERYNGKILATVGFGPDGHVAGVMPYPEDETYFNSTFDTTDRIVASHNARGKNEYSERITVTFPFLRSLSYALTYGCGGQKKEAIQRLLEKDKSKAEIPARILNEIPVLDFYTDQEIA